jgi:hypothetical protein
VCRPSSLLTGEGGRGWERSQIIRPRESLALLPLSKIENKAKWFVAPNAPKLSVYGSVSVSPDGRRDVVELECKLFIDERAKYCKFCIKTQRPRD